MKCTWLCSRICLHGTNMIEDVRILLICKWNHPESSAVIAAIEEQIRVTILFPIFQLHASKNKLNFLKNTTGLFPTTVLSWLLWSESGLNSKVYALALHASGTQA